MVRAGILTREERLELVALHRLLLRTTERRQWNRPFASGNTSGERTRFEEGNDAGVRHGAFSEGRIRPRAEEWRARLAAAMSDAGVHDGLDDIARDRLARSLARADLLEDEVDERGWFREGGDLTPAAVHLVRLDRSIAEQLRQLGLTLRSRAEVRLAAAQAQKSMSVAEVHQLIATVMRAPDDALPRSW